MLLDQIALRLAPVCVCAIVLSGCGSTIMTNSNAANPTGPAPTVIAVGDQVNGVAPNRKQEIQFSEAMDPSTINPQSFQIADSSGKLAQGTVSYDSNIGVASFQPNPALQAGATYTATITTAAASAGGMHLASAYSYKFDTRSTSDTSPLMINSVAPAAGATCVSTTAHITITFDETPDAATLTAANFAVNGPAGPISVKISTNISTTQVSLTPSSPLPSGSIAVTVSNVADLAGVAMAAPYTWSFSTSCSGGGSGSPTTQYMAPLFPLNLLPGGGQVTVDTAGNVMVQLKAASANQSFTVQFCTIAQASLSISNCFSVGALTTNSNGDGSLTAKFPKPGAWAGDFELSRGANPIGFNGDYDTDNGPNYMGTLLGGKPNTGAPTPTNGTVTYSASPAPHGAFTFTVTGAPPNIPLGAAEGGLYDGSSDEQLVDSSGRTTFTTDNSGNVTFTVEAVGPGYGDNVWVDGQIGNSFVVYQSGFVIPQ